MACWRAPLRASSARRLFVASLLTMVASLEGRTQSQDEILIAAIQDGGKVIYLRHATTNPNDADTGRLDDRAGQRNLTPATLDGRWMVRVSIGAELTERAHVERLWGLMQREVSGGSRTS